MSNNQAVLVAALGIPPHEEGILRRIFNLTAGREQTYILTPLDGDPIPDIVLVDADEQDAAIAWHELCERQPGCARALKVLVSQTVRPPSSHPFYLQRPLIAPRVVRVLDRLPLKKQAPSLAAPPPQRKALVVDDSLPVRKQVELELQALGIEADFAESGEQGVEFLDQGTPYDLIFLDVMLPGMDGYSLCKTIKRDKRRKQTPVIMLTGKGSPFDRVRGKLAGCDSYLTKPVAREAFQVVVKKYLSQLLSKEVAIS